MHIGTASETAADLYMWTTFFSLTSCEDWPDAGGALVLRALLEKVQAGGDMTAEEQVRLQRYI